MEPNEIMTNEEVVEAAETAVDEIVTKSSGCNFKTAALGGLVTLIGGLVIQYVVIPKVVKVREKKKNQNTDTIDGEFTVVEDEAENDSYKEVKETK